MTDVFIATHLQFTMLLEQSFVLTHAEHTFRTAYCYESSISSLSITMHFPHFFLFRSYDASFLKAQKSLCKRMIYIDIDKFILILYFFLCTIMNQLFVSPNELPDIIFGNMIGVKRTARDLIKIPTLWHFNFMSMQIVFCF